MNQMRKEGTLRERLHWHPRRQPNRKARQAQTTNESKERETGATRLMAGAAKGEFDEDDNIKSMFLQPATLAKGRSASRADYRSVLMNQSTSHVPKDRILLDNQPTVDVFYNDKLLQNIRKSDTYMDIHCNAGVTSTDMVGDLPGYGEVWYHPNGIANILSLTRVKDKHQVTFDSAGGNKFVVHNTGGTARSFLESRRGLYFMNTATTSTILVNTVDNNKTRYTNCDYSRALLARKLQNIIGRPSTRSLLPKHRREQPAPELPRYLQQFPGRRRHLWTKSRLPKRQDHTNDTRTHTSPTSQHPDQHYDTIQSCYPHHI
jgi:hypothetical protein